MSEKSGYAQRYDGEMFMDDPANLRPIRVESVREKLLDDDLVLYDEPAETVHILNRTGAAIWALCDGRRDVEQVTKDVAQLFGKRAARIRGDVCQMIEELHKVGLVSFGVRKDTGQHREEH